MSLHAISQIKRDLDVTKRYAYVSVIAMCFAVLALVIVALK